MCIFDVDKNKHSWHEDQTLSLSDNMFFASVHFVGLFFNKYKVTRHQNELDFDDMAADCSLAVYESAKRNYEKRDTQYSLSCYMYGRAWSVVGNWLRNYYKKKQRELLDVKRSDNRLTSIEFDVGTDEISSSNYEQGTRYSVWKTAPLPYYEKKLSEAALQWLEYRDECIDMGLDYEDAEDWLTNKNSKETDLKYLGKILNEENPNPRVTKKEVRVSLGKVKHSS